MRRLCIDCIVGSASGADALSRYRPLGGGETATCAAFCTAAPWSRSLQRQSVIHRSFNATAFFQSDQLSKESRISCQVLDNESY